MNCGSIKFDLFHLQVLCHKRSYTQVFSLVVYYNLIYVLILRFLQMHGRKGRVIVSGNIIFIEYLQCICIYKYIFVKIYYKVYKYLQRNKYFVFSRLLKFIRLSYFIYM